MDFKLRPFLLSTLLSIAGLCFPASLRAQFLGYTSPQTVNQQIFAGVNTSMISPASNPSQGVCTATPTVACAIPNIGQSIHYITIFSSQTRDFRVTLQGSNDGTTWFDMADGSSDSTSNAGVQGLAAFSASGSFTAYRLNLICGVGSGVISVWYSGTSVSNGEPGGAFNPSNRYRRVLALAPNTDLTLTSVTSSVFPPAGNTQSTLYFDFNSNACAGGSISVQAGPDNAHLAQIATFTPANSVLTQQAFSIPATNNGVLDFSYTACGSETYDAILVFSSNPITGYSYQNVTGTTAVAVKASDGILHTLTVNTGAAGTIGIFDLAAASCTGTPSTNKVATVTATTSSLTSLLYDLSFSNGICVKASAAIDFTVSYQ